MHEYSLVQSVVEAALAEVAEHNALRATRMKLEVGEFAFCSDEALHHAWSLLVPDTPLADCQLEVERVQATLECPSCGYHGPAPVPPGAAEESASPPGSPPLQQSATHPAEDHHHLPPLACPKCGGVPELASGSGLIIRNMELELEEDT